MASYIDLGSSPDPLGDDDDMDLLPTSSMRPPPSRRANTKTISTGHTSMLSMPDSNKSRFSAPRTSPRKQTFELDVGDERSPQRLLVTVEANEAMANATQRSGTNRRLFGSAAPSSSPARSRGQRRETTTTTRVPLRGLSDDEGGALGNDMNTPRKRGRPLGSKNGTPAPQGKKRAGTPLARMSPAKTRQRKNPESEMSMFSSDAQLDMGTDAVDPEDEPTPKAKPIRARKNTPAAKRAGGTPAAASASKATGRKRGRPRKALNPDEMAMLTSEIDNREINSDLLLPSEDPKMNDAPSEMEAIPEGNEESYSRHELAPSTSPLRDAPRNHSPPPNEEPPSDNQDIADLIDQLVNEGQEEEEPGNNMSYGAMREAESDDESDGAPGSEATYGKTDPLEHASDFSMIAVESLPSFQASFQASQNGGSRFGNSQQSRFAQSGDETNFMINRSLRTMKSSAQGDEAPRFPEGGDETNFMINQSLRSLRGPPQQEEEPARQEKSQPVSSARKPASSAQKPSSSAPNYSSPSNYVMSSPQTWSKSPKRPRQTPLSRQVFGKKAPNTGDSFSSIPDSVLRDATPGKAMARPTNVEQHETEDDEMHDDSFSELPDEVLEAATPGPSTRTARNPGSADNPGSQLFSADVHSAARSTNNAFGAARLPTPDDTNSSTTGSKNAHEDESRNPSGEPSTAAMVSSDLIMRSSPPRIGVQHADDVEMEQPAQSDGNAMGTPSPQNSSPSPQYPRITKLDSPGLGDLLQPPMSTRRPTLSPIVRVGRSLQHVMSDRSSPEGRESSLGSPFRRSGSDSRQSSVQKSPVNEKHETFHQSASKSVFNPIASLAQNIRANFSQVSQHGPTPSMTGRADDHSGADKSQLPPAADSLNKSTTSAPSSSRRHTLQGAEQFPLLTSSARADPPSEAFPDWNGENSSPSAQRTRRMSAPRQFPSMNSSNLFGARGANISRVEPVQEDVAKEEEIEDEPIQVEQHSDIQHEDEQDFSESEQEQFEGGDDMGYDDEESDHEPADQEEEEQDAINDQLQSEANDDERSRGQAEEEDEEEEEEALEQSVERDVSEDESEHGRADEEPVRDDHMETEHGFDENTGAQNSFDESLESQPTFDMGDDGMDLWDIEASRPTPKSTKLVRAEKRARRQSQVDVIARSSQSREASLLHGSIDGAPSRRKVPSPWKKNTRRLIYQDDFKSPAHIEMDGSTQSESPEEEFSLIAQLTAQDDTPMRQEQSRSQAQQMRQERFREDNEQGSAEYPRGVALAQIEEEMSPEQPYQERSSHSPAPEQPYQERSSPSPAPEQHYHQQSSPSPAPEPVKETEDYSLLAQQKQEQEVAKPPEKPARRSGLFGAFDIMSFFSSPAPLPTANTPGGAPETATRPIPKPFVRAQAQSSATKSQPEEPRSVLRATGLFPSIPQKTLFQRSPARTIDLFRSSPERQSNLSRSSPEHQTDGSHSSPQREAELPPANPERETNLHHSNPERTIDLFSPATALRSGDTVADTYAESPSTPEREEFPHIPQKQNFTPRSGRSRNTASLFTPSVAPSTPDRDQMAEEDDAPEQEEQDYYQREQESDDYDGDDAAAHDDSVMTVETDYERLPPREQPSKWDKNASPAKSCLRSPLKPKTPGRVTWMMGRQALGSAGTGGNSLGQGRPRPQFAGFEDEEEDEEFEQDDKENSPSPPKESNYFPPQFGVTNNSQRAVSPAKPENNHFPLQFAGNNNGQRSMSPAKAVVAPPNIKMPATTIFRAPNSQGLNAASGIKPLISLKPFSRAAATGIGNTSNISNTSSTGNGTGNTSSTGSTNNANGISSANHSDSTEGISSANRSDSTEGISSADRSDSNNGISSTNGTGTGAVSNENTLTWLKSHWIHLDELLQLRRNEPAKFRQRQARSHAAVQQQSQSERGSSEEPPASAALLGKEVSAQGERILLEAWHLEIMDTFRDEVGPDRCWDEKALAKRLFALIVGEERRRRGVKGREGVAA
ncbi:hypothetical protein PG991_011759 [Apiospora marii]|uniref:Uncharacterized protein n=1 Tax=Apiospora marii TaxID=335849 RepID=A0ABR1RF73_9PEZI